jgi:PKD repeat protein
MRRIPLLSLLIITLFGLMGVRGLPADQTESENIKEVLKIEEERTQAVLKGDADVLERIYSDDFAYTNESGENPTKAQFVANFRSGSENLSSMFTMTSTSTRTETRSY